MSAQVGSNGKVSIKGRVAERLLEDGEVRCLPSDEGEELLAEGVPPCRETSTVYHIDDVSLKPPIR